MIRSGDTIENAVTGERLRFLRTARDTGGESVVVDVTLRPDGFVAGAHVHPHQHEEFHVLAGRVGFRLGRERVEKGPGDLVVVEPGTAHEFWNAGDEPARFVTVVRPALRFEQLIETMFSLAAEGKTNRKGMPNPLRLAVITDRHFDDVRLPFPPAFLQRMAISLGAPLGRALGYGPSVEATPGALALAQA
jgi:quercetin dioxygenase-like cupin family protein